MPALSIVGANVLCYINGRLLGRVMDFNWESTTPRKPLKTIDMPIPLELMPTGGMVHGNMTLIRTKGDGGAQSAGMVAPFQTDLSREKYFTIVIVEKINDLTLFKADYCSSESESWVVNPRGFLTGQVTFTGITWTNESTT